MEDHRSKSCNDSRMQLDNTYTNGDAPPPHYKPGGGGGELKKGKSCNGVVSKNWSFNDPELKRKKRVASYKAYTVEGKLKGSFKKSFSWIKESLVGSLPRAFFSSDLPAA
ncbi:hypothetical protein DH2020_014602 [Rehmannia glutinosa]|uniref:DUF3511 domain protein n=1 Tax=Rehmannia glutinosa TaxID=99300 RepID=A0ABR0WWW4_REHGL